MYSGINYTPYQSAVFRRHTKYISLHRHRGVSEVSHLMPSKVLSGKKFKRCVWTEGLVVGGSCGFRGREEEGVRKRE